MRLVKKNAIVVLIFQGKETWDSLDLNLDLLNFGGFFFFSSSNILILDLCWKLERSSHVLRCM